MLSSHSLNTTMELKFENLFCAYIGAIWKKIKNPLPNLGKTNKGEVMVHAKSGKMVLGRAYNGTKLIKG